MRSRQAAVSGQDAAAIQGFGARGRHSALTWLFGRPTRKQGKKRGLFQTECAILAEIRRFCTYMDSVQSRFSANEWLKGGL